METKKTIIDSERAAALLFPLAAFLRAGGITQSVAQASFAAAFERALKESSARRFDHIGHPTQYADIVGLWTRDPRFLDSGGRPRLLPMRGKRGFIRLVRESSPDSDPEVVLSVFLRYGNVRRSRSGYYELIRPFFFSTRRKSMAFEPMAYFLSDASMTLGRILRRTRRSRDPEVFWRKVESVDISDVHVREFIEYVRERSLTFLEEVDDWLEAHRTARKSRRARSATRRIGLGLFSIYSEPESFRTIG